MKTLLYILLAVLIAAGASAQPVPDTLWTRVYPEYHPAQPRDIIPSFDGGLVWTGIWLVHADSVDGHSDVIVMETDGLGNPRWVFQVEGGQPDTIWSGVSVCRTSDSCYMALGQRHCGGTPSNFLFKLNRNGEEIWRRECRFSPFDLGHSLAALEDGAFVLCVTSWAHNDTFNVDYPFTMVAKLNAAGDTVWTYSALGSPVRVVAISGGFMLLGGINPYALLTKLDADGHEVWTREYNDVSIAAFVDLAENSQGYFAAGKSRAYGSDNFALLHVDFNGEPVTIREFIPANHCDERVLRMVRSPDGGFVLGGYAANCDEIDEASLMLLKTDSLGARQWRTNTVTSLQASASAFCALPDGGFAFGGLASEFGVGGWPYLFLARYGAAGTSPVSIRPVLPEEIALAQNHPNPFNPVTQISFDLPKALRMKLVVHDLLGREVAVLVDDFVAAGHHTVAFDGSSLASGLYFYTMSSAGQSQTRKMMLLK